VTQVTLLLRGGHVVDPQAGLDEVCDVLVKDGRIAEVGRDLTAGSGTKIVECAEKIVVPGLVDMHVHLREPGFEYKEDVESGTRAAAHGGFTAVAAMPNTSPVCDEGRAVRFLRERAAERGKVRVYPIGALTVGLKGEALAEMGDMLAEGAVAFSDDGKGVQSTGMMRLVMDYAKQFDAVVIAHSEDEALAGKGVVNEGVVSTRLGLPGWPAAAEDVMVARDIRLSELTGCRLHLAHISTAGCVELVRQAKAKGLRVTAEATPHHLFLDEDSLTAEYSTNMKMNPPLRSAEDREALVAGLLDGTVDCIATDHAPHAPHEKALEFEIAPFGSTGLETALPLVITNLIATKRAGWVDLARWMAVNPRAALKLPEVSLEVGSVADITVIDPEARVEVTPEFFESKSANSAFLRATLLGKAAEVVVGGRLALRNGKVVE
jgi:dihydroorotase